jgi:hypothetical protein
MIQEFSSIGSERFFRMPGAVAQIPLFFPDHKPDMIYLNLILASGGGNLQVGRCGV